MPEITLRLVDRHNWRATLYLAVLPEQQRFSARFEPVTAFALAKAFIRPDGLVWTPYAIYADGSMVGFLELAHQPDSAEQYWIYHFFVDHRHQGQGYGAGGLRELIRLVRSEHLACRALQLTVHPDNERARRLYARVGFRPTGEVVDAELVYRLDLLNPENP